MVLASEIATALRERGKTVWFDVKMEDRSVAAMEEGVKNSDAFIAVVTGACVSNDSPGDDPVSNAYFKRDFCLQELRWAREARKAVQPVVRVEDKSRIGEFLALAPDDLKSLGAIDWVDLNRNDREYWELGMRKVMRGVDSQKRRQSQPEPEVDVTMT